MPAVSSILRVMSIVSLRARLAVHLRRAFPGALAPDIPSDLPPVVPPVILALVLLCCGVELLLTAADHGLIGTRLWRSLSYQYGGFWAGLLHDWQPNYRLQPVSMFFTHAVLHAGPGHLFGNMISLMALGAALRRAFGPRALAALLAASAFGGALAFGLMSHSPTPMVGASGAIFGLAGAWTLTDDAQRRRQGLRSRALAIALGLAGLNAAVWWAEAGQLAWQAHLGGYLTGLAGAALALYFAPILAKTRS